MGSPHCRRPPTPTNLESLLVAVVSDRVPTYNIRKVTSSVSVASRTSYRAQRGTHTNLTGNLVVLHYELLRTNWFPTQWYLDLLFIQLPQATHTNWTWKLVGVFSWPSTSSCEPTWFPTQSINLVNCSYNCR